MTSPEYILSRAAAKGGQYEQWVGGGLSAFTSAQVGHFLAGMLRGDKGFTPLPDGAVRVLLLRYADGDDRDAEELLKDLMYDSGRARDWATATANMAICRAVLREFMSARRCGVCEGRTTVMRGNLVESCTDCDATGYKPLSDTNRAKACGTPYTAFRRGPAERFYVARLKRLHDWEGMGLHRVIEKARDGVIRLSSLQESVLRKLAAGIPARVHAETFRHLEALPGLNGRIYWESSPPFPDGGGTVLPTAGDWAALKHAIRDLFAATGVSLAGN